MLRFLKTSQSFPKIPEEVRRCPKSPEDVWSLPKTSEVYWSWSYRENAYPQGPTLADNFSAIVLKSESFGLTCSFFKAVVMLVFPETAICMKTWELARTFTCLMSDLPNLHTVMKAETALTFPSPSLRTCINASSLPMLFTSKIRDREVKYCHLLILHMVFVP